MEGYYRDSNGYYKVSDMLVLCERKLMQEVSISALLHNTGNYCWNESTTTPHMVMWDQDPERFSSHKRRILEADLSCPTTVLEGSYDILDGFHRLCKAIQEKRRIMECFILTLSDLRSIRTYH